MGRAKEVTKFIQRFDRELFCEMGREGKLCVFRKGQSVESYDVDGQVIHFIRPTPYLVFALTDDWTIHGEPREWGLMPILTRLQEIDLWNRDLAKESLESIEKGKNSRERALDNHLESFLKENRREFARLTNDINTSTLTKKIS